MFYVCNVLLFRVINHITMNSTTRIIAGMRELVHVGKYRAG